MLFISFAKKSIRISRAHTCNPRMPRSRGGELVACNKNHTVVSCYDGNTMTATPTRIPFLSVKFFKSNAVRDYYQYVCVYVFGFVLARLR